MANLAPRQVCRQYCIEVPSSQEMFAGCPQTLARTFTNAGDRYLGTDILVDDITEPPGTSSP